MSFEQQPPSFSGQPPTPTRTPPAPESFHGNVFQTPKAVESSFYDPRVTWNTADPSASPDLLRTPRPFAPSTPAGKQGSSFETPSKSRNLAVNAAQLLTTPNFSLLSQIPSPGLAVSQEKSGSMESNMRTPPPTNGGNAKRKEKQNEASRTHQRSESSNRQLLPKPADAGPSNTPVEATPLQFTPIAFGTPDFFNQHGELPATAPVYPQQRLFWDNNNPNEMELDFSADNPFATPKPPGLEPFVSQHEAQTQPMLHQNNFQGSFLDFDQVIAHPDYNTNLQPGALDVGMTSFGQGVDPNLLFSSSSIAGLSLQAPLQDSSLQPYAYQVQEARRQRAYAGIDKAKRRRKPSVDSPAVAAALETLRDSSARPGVSRSMTDSHLPRSGRSSSSSSRAGTSHGGRSSPLKSLRSDTKRRHRQSVGLVVGSDGRARIETVIHQEGGASPRGGRDMDVDSTAYSSESESTQSDDNDAGQNALVTSFSSETGSGPGMPKMGRFGSGGAHSQKSSFSSMYSSNSEPTKSRKPSSKRTSRHILDPVKEGGSFEDDRSRSADNAQAALMHSMKASQRGRFSPQKQSGGLEPFVSSPSTIPDSSGFATPTSNSSGRRNNKR